MKSNDGLLLLGAGGAFVSGVVWAITDSMADFENIDPAVPNVAKVFLFAFGALAAFRALSQFFFRISEVKIKSPILYDVEREDAALDKLSADDRQLATLLEYNRQQVLRYHDIVTEQASRSFRAGQAASTMGLLVLVVCLWTGLTHQGADVKWFSGAVAGIGTAISAFINHTYMRMYDKSILQLNQYFDQPVVNGYYLTAERMAKLNMKNAELQDRIIEGVLASANHISLKNLPRRTAKARVEGSTLE